MININTDEKLLDVVFDIVNRIHDDMQRIAINRKGRLAVNVGLDVFKDLDDGRIKLKIIEKELHRHFKKEKVDLDLKLSRVAHKFIISVKVALF